MCSRVVGEVTRTSSTSSAIATSSTRQSTGPDPLAVALREQRGDDTGGRVGSLEVSRAHGRAVRNTGLQVKERRPRGCRWG